jgi:hypothetical protein
MPATRDSRTRFPRWGGAALLALFGLLAGCGARQIASCQPAEDVVCGVSRPEDLEVVPGTRWLMVAGNGPGENAGHIQLVDPATKTVRTIAGDGPPMLTPDSTFPHCGPPPDRLRPSGFHLSAAEDGAERLLVINRMRVEHYRALVRGDDVSLTWDGCVTIPDEVAPNDIAALGDRGFVLSHMFAKPRTWFTTAKLLLGLNTGGAYRWTRDGGWARIPNSDASFGNGIQVDPRTGRIYLASMFDQRIIAIDLDGGHRQVSARIPMQNDNLSWSSDGRLIGTGHTGIGIIGTQKCKDLKGLPCSFPFAVIAIDPKTLAFQTLYTYQTGDIPGPSVAILKEAKLYLGTVFGDRISIVTPELGSGSR